MTSESNLAAEPQLAVVDGERELRELLDGVRRSGRRIGVVPTMGALHAGHMSLIDAARAESDFVVVTIFVNPTQFGPQEDYKRYPRPLSQDLTACRNAGVDLVFTPSTDDMYPSGFCTHVEVTGLSERLEGAFRPGHFRGVATVVLKLLLQTQPHAAYFGEKDYQQQLLVKTMCRDLNVPTDIVTCPIVRDADGLAISSRNEYLSPEQRQHALTLHQSLQIARDQLRSGEDNVAAVRTAMRRHLEATPDVRVDYATVADPETLEELEHPQREMIALVAARLGDVRLIDNLPIRL